MSKEDNVLTIVGPQYIRYASVGANWNFDRLTSC